MKYKPGTTDIETLPTDYLGRTISFDGKPLSTDIMGRIVGEHASPLPTNAMGQIIYVPTEPASVIYPTDEMGRYVFPIVGPDGKELSKNSAGETIDQLGRIIEKNEEGFPLGPDGIILKKNTKGEWVYPILGKDGEPLPTDLNLRPIYPIVGQDQILFSRNEQGLNVDNEGNIIPTDIAGRPVSIDGSPYPTDKEHRFIIAQDEEAILIIPTDDLGRKIYPVAFPNGEILPTDESGRHIDENGDPIPTDDFGLPISEDGKILNTDSQGRFV